MARSRQAEHDAIDGLLFEPGRAAEKVYLTPLQRRQLHTAVDEKWDKMKEDGKQAQKTAARGLQETEDKLVDRFDTLENLAQATLATFADGEIDIEDVEKVLAELDKRYEGARVLEAQHAERMTAAEGEAEDPEEYAAQQQEQLEATFPALRTRRSA
jgi:hypothetical protein